MTSEFLLIFSTCPDRDSARQISLALIEAGLAACVSQLPGVTSTYRWEGKLCQDEEVMLMIKSDTKRFMQIEQCITGHHPFDVPEVIAVPVIAGSDAYLAWVAGSLTPTGN